MVNPKIKRFIKVLSGFGTLKDLCWFSETFWDLHDYPRKKGGDGTPSHFHTYTCTSCGKHFTI